MKNWRIVVFFSLLFIVGIFGAAFFAVEPEGMFFDVGDAGGLTSLDVTGGPVPVGIEQSDLTAGFQTEVNVFAPINNATLETGDLNIRMVEFGGVPESSTLLLLGLGVIGVIGISRRRMNKVIKMGKSILSLALLAASMLWASPSGAMHIKLAFEEIAQSADLIYMGTVEKQISRFNEKGMIVTDVYFKEVTIIHATDRSQQKDLSEIRLTYAGGRVGDKGVTVSGTPTFQDGHRYLIFMWDDGKTYSNPIVGGAQGLFELTKDTVSQKEFVLTAGRKAVVEVSPKGIRVHHKRVSHLQDGKIIGKESLQLTFRTLTCSIYLFSEMA
jgi:hypothetical protein